MSPESPPASAPGPAPAAAGTPPFALSVVIPTHDTRELTLACLAALAAAQPPPNEIIVVDDGSSDGTAAEVAASYSAVQLLRHERSRGFTAAANAGAAKTTGDLLLLLNSDTEPAADALCSLRSATTRGSASRAPRSSTPTAPRSGAAAARRRGFGSSRSAAASRTGSAACAGGGGD